jgi:hypothetical protein
MSAWEIHIFFTFNFDFYVLRELVSRSNSFFNVSLSKTKLSSLDRSGKRTIVAPPPPQFLSVSQG